jgi:hypothetical protein
VLKNITEITSELALLKMKKETNLGLKNKLIYTRKP